MAQYVVMNGDDDGSNSLRAGLSDPSVTEIIFDPSITLVTLTNDELFIDRSLTITGSGMGGVEITRNSTNTFRIFHVTNGVTIAINGLTISGGDGNMDDGAGILVEDSSNLSLDHCIITNIANGGGVMLTSTSTLTVSYCIISSNTAIYGGGIYCDVNCIYTIRNSLFYNNTLFFYGGGLYLILNNGSIYNSTFTENNSNYGGGLYVSANVSILNATIAYNTASLYGGGIYQDSGTCTVGNCIVANNNTINLNFHDVFGDFNSLGYNLIGNTTGSTGFDSPDDLVNVDPMLGTLGFYGGPTQTIPL